MKERPLWISGDDPTPTDHADNTNMKTDRSNKPSLDERPPWISDLVVGQSSPIQEESHPNTNRSKNPQLMTERPPWISELTDDQGSPPDNKNNLKTNRSYKSLSVKERPPWLSEFEHQSPEPVDNNIDHDSLTKSPSNKERPPWLTSEKEEARPKELKQVENDSNRTENQESGNNSGNDIQVPPLGRKGLVKKKPKNYVPNTFVPNRTLKLKRTSSLNKVNNINSEGELNNDDVETSKSSNNPYNSHTYIDESVSSYIRESESIGIRAPESKVFTRNRSNSLSGRPPSADRSSSYPTDKEPSCQVNSSAVHNLNSMSNLIGRGQIKSTGKVWK